MSYYIIISDFLQSIALTIANYCDIIIGINTAKEDPSFELKERLRNMYAWEINYDLKIRVNLSTLALNVMEQDQITFRAKSRTQFLNQVFLNSYLRAEASIASKLESKEQEYAFLLNDTSISKDQKAVVIKKLLQREKAAFLEKQDDYDKAHKSFLHTLSVQVTEVIESEAVRAESEFYTIPQYFKAVIEEYCRKPLIQREMIYFKNHFEVIQQAIEQNKQIEVCNYSNSKYLVHPVTIMPDALSSANYLVGYARKPQQNIGQKGQSSFRIANLKSVRQTGKDAFLSKEEKSRIDKAIYNQGVQFLVGETKTIQIKLTPKGIQKYNRHSTLRPIYIEKTDDGIYTFNCTETQAEYYFMRLGADVEILSPTRLRNKFKKMHSNAVKAYEDTDIN